LVLNSQVLYLKNGSHGDASLSPEALSTDLLLFYKFVRDKITQKNIFFYFFSAI